jgi:hypothetical protein
VRLRRVHHNGFRFQATLLLRRLANGDGAWLRDNSHVDRDDAQLPPDRFKDNDTGIQRVENVFRLARRANIAG